jgi:hypothetical protein
MANNVNSVRKSIDALRMERAKIADEIDRKQALIEQIDQSIASLEATLRAIAAGDKPSRQPPTQTGRMRPTDAVYQYLLGHPNSSSGDVVAAVADKIATTSADPKKVLHSTIAQMNGRRIVRDEHTGLLRVKK